MVAQEFTVDLNKPLVFQVGHLGEAYQEWVHQPIVSVEGPRFFASDFWEFLTKNEWYVIPTIWLPVVCWYATKAFKMGNSLPEIAMILVLGIFIWTLMEYSLHRFLFHIKTKTYWGNTLHYLLHGCHHKHPQDGLRLVFPPTATAILLFPLWNIVKLISTPAVAPALFAGILLGYVMYDVTHYYLHHGQPKSEVPKHLKKYHLNHHFRIQNKGYGITSSLWDKVSSNFENPVVARLHFRFQSNHAQVQGKAAMKVKERHPHHPRILSYGLLNTAYYLSAFLVAWFYIAPAPGKMGYWIAVKRFVKLMAMVWAGSQVTKLARLGGALVLAPIVDKGLSWFMAKFKFESQAKAFSVIVGCCFGLAAVLFIIVTLLSA
ncbi:fatty acid hydroxylase 1 [Artemisia annua]|uniref:Fatty acid hydroxylase 1 n=1 Tax=Artemisia annua TaxID=35608 RepID=A0A2U1LEI3_ARTAN|nr:fatty acid hydroxylase 1 [Artemisia annua]